MLYPWKCRVAFMTENILFNFIARYPHFEHQRERESIPSHWTKIIKWKIANFNNSLENEMTRSWLWLTLKRSKFSFVALTIKVTSTYIKIIIILDICSENRDKTYSVADKVKQHILLLPFFNSKGPLEKKRWVLF